jgi:hypothetical protein
VSEAGEIRREPSVMTSYRVTVTRPELVGGRDAPDRDMEVRDAVIRATTTDSLRDAKETAARWLDEHHSGEPRAYAMARSDIAGWDGREPLTVGVPASSGDPTGLVRVSIEALPNRIRARYAIIAVVVTAMLAVGTLALVANPFAREDTAEAPGQVAGDTEQASRDRSFCDLYEVAVEHIPRSGPHRSMPELEMLASAAESSSNSRIAHYGSRLLFEIDRVNDPADLMYGRTESLIWAIDSTLDAWSSECP